MSENRTNWCRHHVRIYVPTLGHECKLGLDIEAMTTAQCGPDNFGRHYMLPCHTGVSENCPKAVCDKRSLFTDAEVAAQDAESKAHVAEAVRRLKLTLPLVEDIKRRTKTLGADLHGSACCPACRTGMLNYSCSIYNLHVHARCTTPDCLNFME